MEQQRTIVVMEGKVAVDRIQSMGDMVGSSVSIQKTHTHTSISICCLPFSQLLVPWYCSLHLLPHITTNTVLLLLIIIIIIIAPPSI